MALRKNLEGDEHHDRALIGKALAIIMTVTGALAAIVWAVIDFGNIIPGANSATQEKIANAEEQIEEIKRQIENYTALPSLVEKLQNDLTSDIDALNSAKNAFDLEMKELRARTRVLESSATEANIEIRRNDGAIKELDQRIFNDAKEIARMKALQDNYGGRLTTIDGQWVRGSELLRDARERIGKLEQQIRRQQFTGPISSHPGR